jgi:hypothetical protein
MEASKIFSYHRLLLLVTRNCPESGLREDFDQSPNRPASDVIDQLHGNGTPYRLNHSHKEYPL